MKAILCTFCFSRCRCFIYACCVFCTPPLSMFILFQLVTAVCVWSVKNESLDSRQLSQFFFFFWSNVLSWFSENTILSSKTWFSPQEVLVQFSLDIYKTNGKSGGSLTVRVNLGYGWYKAEAQWRRRHQWRTTRKNKIYFIMLLSGTGGELYINISALLKTECMKKSH